MKIEETSLPGVLLLTPKIHRDNRGAFWETWNQKAAAEAGLPSAWAQDNFSVSRKNVIRGIHYQIIQPQGKLVRVTHGAVLDVAVDLRRSSPTFGQHVAVELSPAKMAGCFGFPKASATVSAVLSRGSRLRLQGHRRLLLARRTDHRLERSGYSQSPGPSLPKTQSSRTKIVRASPSGMRRSFLDSVATSSRDGSRRAGRAGAAACFRRSRSTDCL